MNTSTVLSMIEDGVLSSVEEIAGALDANADLLLFLQTIADRKDIGMTKDEYSVYDNQVQRNALKAGVIASALYDPQTTIDFLNSTRSSEMREYVFQDILKGSIHIGAGIPMYRLTDDPNETYASNLYAPASVRYMKDLVKQVQNISTPTGETLLIADDDFPLYVEVAVADAGYIMGDLGRVLEPANTIVGLHKMIKKFPGIVSTADTYNRTCVLGLSLQQVVLSIKRAGLDMKDPLRAKIKKFISTYLKETFTSYIYYIPVQITVDIKAGTITTKYTSNITDLLVSRMSSTKHAGDMFYTNLRETVGSAGLKLFKEDLQVVHESVYMKHTLPMIHIDIHRAMNL